MPNIVAQSLFIRPRKFWLRDELAKIGDQGRNNGSEGPVQRGLKVTAAQGDRYRQITFQYSKINLLLGSSSSNGIDHSHSIVPGGFDVTS